MSAISLCSSGLCTPNWWMCLVQWIRFCATPWLSSPQLQTCFLHFNGRPPPVKYDWYESRLYTIWCRILWILVFATWQKILNLFHVVVHVECGQRFLCKYCQNGLSGVTALASIFTWLIQRGYRAVVWSGVDKQAGLYHSRWWNYGSGLAYIL
jgi:hypothetical protein